MSVFDHFKKRLPWYETPYFENLNNAIPKAMAKPLVQAFTWGLEVHHPGLPLELGRPGRAFGPPADAVTALQVSRGRKPPVRGAAGNGRIY